MFTRKDMANVISERFADKNGKRIPKYFAELMVDYVVEAIKIGLIEDGVVCVMDRLIFERIDVPSHKKKMPNGSIIDVPDNVRIKLRPSKTYITEIIEEDEA